MQKSSKRVQKMTTFIHSDINYRRFSPLIQALRQLKDSLIEHLALLIKFVVYLPCC